MSKVPCAPTEHRINTGWKSHDWAVNDMDLNEKQPDEENCLASRGIGGGTEVVTYFTTPLGRKGPKMDHSETRSGNIMPPKGT